MRPLRIVVSSIGWTGHAFPAFALARELHGRGHAVTVESFERWRPAVEDLGIGFLAAPERMDDRSGTAREGEPTLAGAARGLARTFADLGPDVVVHDLFTLAPAFAAELAEIPRATLIPHPYPVRRPGHPFYTLGLRPPRTPLGTALWRALWPAVGTRLPNTDLRGVRARLDRERAELGLGPLPGFDGQISERLALVATFPQLEYPRTWPGHVRVTGPMPFELGHPDAELPPGDDPLVVIAPSTERDPDARLLRTALEALAGEPVRVIASRNRAGAAPGPPVPANARVVDWLSYSQALAQASLTICHGGHGTIARSLAASVPVLVCPPAGDMAENGARVAWAGAGTLLPHRLLSPRSLRASAMHLLADRRAAARARELGDWAAGHDGAATAAALVEELAG